MGVLFLTLSTALRYQFMLDHAATTMNFSETGLNALSLEGMGSRIAAESLTGAETSIFLLKPLLLNLLMQH